MAGDLNRYVDFVLRISPSTEAGQFAVKAVSPWTGEASGIFVPPFTETELENFILKVGTSRRGVRGIHTSEWRAAQGFGEKLYSRLFQDDIRASFLSSRNDALREGKGLRIKIVLEAQALADYPWEFLYDPSLGRFLTLYESTPLVRYVELPVPPQAMRVTPPLRILVLAASPVDLPPLDISREKANLDAALSDLVLSGLVSVEWVEQASLEALRLRLLKREAHVFHFIGHGYFDQNSRDGILALEDQGRHSKLVSSERLAVVLGSHSSLRLAVLNACEGGRSSVQDPFASAATTLLRSGGLAAVVAMQFDISDAASIAFTSGFYSALAQGRPVDAAVSQGRLSIFTGDNDVEWATPVLYLRSPDGVIFSQPSAEGAARVAPERAGDEQREHRLRENEQTQKHSISLFLTALAWSVGLNVVQVVLRLPLWLMLGRIPGVGDNTIPILPMILLGLLGMIAGGIGGLAMRRKSLPVSLKQSFLAAAGWGIGWAIVVIVSREYTSGLSVYLPELAGGLLGILGVLAWSRGRPNLKPGASWWGVLGRLGVVALLFSGALGPWFEVSACTYGAGEPPPPVVQNGYQILFTSAGLTPLILPLFLLFAVVVLRLAWPRLRSDNTGVWLERIGAAASMIGLGLYTLMPNQKNLWGFWVTLNGCALSLVIQAVEWFRGESGWLPASAAPPETGRRPFWRSTFWRRVPVFLAVGLLLAVLIATLYGLMINP